MMWLEDWRIQGAELVTTIAASLRTEPERWEFKVGTCLSCGNIWIYPQRWLFWPVDLRVEGVLVPLGLWSRLRLFRAVAVVLQQRTEAELNKPAEPASATFTVNVDLPLPAPAKDDAKPIEPPKPAKKRSHRKK
jgi:hypothetical protein